MFGGGAARTGRCRPVDTARLSSPQNDRCMHRSTFGTRITAASKIRVCVKILPGLLRTSEKQVAYLLLDRFRALFEGGRYRHRDSSLGDSVAVYLPDDLYALRRSQKLASRIDSGERVMNVQNRLRGIKARRGDGTFGELIPNTNPVKVPGFIVCRGSIATVEIGTEVKILAKAMIKQIDRVIGDLVKQVGQFRRAGGNPICVGMVGVNYADEYTSYEGEKVWRTDGRKYKHPIQEAADAEARLTAQAAPAFDEFLILRFRTRNEPPFPFGWLDEVETSLDYGAALTRILRRYEARF